MLPALDNARVAVIGLGYVGLPLATAFGRHFPTTGFDISTRRIEQLRAGRDVTGEVSAEELAASPRLGVTADEAELKAANVYIVTVPTPIDEAKRPDMHALVSASETVGRVIGPGDVVIYESTVYPGA
ncbi:MAG: Vi polysaccharide biosynthesis UDP-N-acetylglucosamine C-6 dehydrogenase TviB, partial [Pseudomonadales bacterium]|nr:Vi polysaccharide biosynthesis UDP-N-acetylglucosamine C-6 dehydrogenase TviB [Pseudomonadales bacterium]